MLALAVRDRILDAGARLMEPVESIRATVVGASQYTIQVSGSTIFITPESAVPVRNVPVVKPELELTADEIEPGAIHAGMDQALTRLDLAHANTAIAVAFHWGGSATFKRLHDFCTGIREGMREFIARGHPIILVNDGDIGGLLGLHLTEEMGVEAAVISIDGIDLNEFDFIDIGELIPTSGAVPVVIKSLVFPATS